MLKLIASVALIAPFAKLATARPGKAARDAPFPLPAGADPFDMRDEDRSGEDDDLEACLRATPANITADLYGPDGIVWYLTSMSPPMAVCGACVNGSSIEDDIASYVDYDGNIVRNCTNGPEALVLWDPQYLFG